MQSLRRQFNILNFFLEFYLILNKLNLKILIKFALISLFFALLEPPEPSPGQCAADQYMCVSDRRCVPLSSICNGIPECRDGSDEHNCGKSMTYV